jgi:hypothetical protein
MDETEPDFNYEVVDRVPAVSQAIAPTNELVSLFELVITRHIKVNGYPQHPQLEPLVSEEESARELKSPTVCACKLLKFASSSELMPQGLWTLTVSSSCSFNILSD